MSRRERDRRVATAERGPDGRPRSAAPPPGIPEAPRPSLREQLASATVAARALLPIRFFFGITFLYAGVDKLLDPTFLDGVSATSLAAQLADFARVSPLAPLVKVGESFATPLGLLIAFLEIAIGLGR